MNKKTNKIPLPRNFVEFSKLLFLLFNVIVLLKKNVTNPFVLYKSFDWLIGLSSRTVSNVFVQRY